MREVARLLLDSRPLGRSLELSLDSIPAADAHEVLSDLGMDAWQLHLVDWEESVGGGVSAARIAAKHRTMYDRGQVSICLTCIDSVGRILRQQNIPVRRVRHANSVIKQSLQKCLLIAQMERHAGGQVSVLLMEGDAREEVERCVSLSQTARSISAAVGGKLVASDQWRAEVVTTRRAVEDWVSATRGDTAPAWTEATRELKLGIGFGDSVTAAEHSAEQAVAKCGLGEPMVAEAAGAPMALSELQASAQPLLSKDGVLQVARRTGLSATTVQRTVTAVQRIGSQDLTVNQLSAVLDLAGRSARRLLRNLEEQGFADPVGNAQGDGPGRPQAVYRIRVDKLLQTAQ